MVPALPYSPDAESDDEPERAYFMETGVSSDAVAEYLAEMIGELESIARKSGLDLLAYLLSMAHSEARNNAHSAQEFARKP